MHKAFALTRKETGFRSRFEATLAGQMPQDALYEAAEIVYPIRELSKYKPDWILPKQCMIVEAKGFFCKADREKMKRVKEAYPGLDIRLIFMRNEKITAKQTYKDWCDKNGFPCAFGFFPPEWDAKEPTDKEREIFNRELMDFLKD